MGRGKVEIPQRMKDLYKEKYGMEGYIPIWSHSKVSSFRNCSHEYFLNRIKKLESKDNVYSLAGSVSHDTIEQFYKGEIQKDQMLGKFETGFLDIEISDFKFSNDESRNEGMSKKYKECVSHFFIHHNAIKSKVVIEQLIWIDVDGNLFMGYVDAITKDKDGNYLIVDWKTSTIYKGKKIAEQGKQLLLYALGLYQAGVPLEKIKVCWNFLKYLHVSYKQKNGKIKTSSVERNKWVSAIKTPLKKDLIAFYDMEEWQADIKIEELIKQNSLDGLDQSIQDKYTTDDCYVYPEVTEEILEQLKAELVQDIKDINEKGKDEVNWQREEIQASEEYYCNVLCGLKAHCSYYTDMLKRKGLKQREEEDIMKILDDIPF